MLFWPQDMWDPSSPIRDQTRTCFTGKQSLNHWTTREVPVPPRVLSEELEKENLQPQQQPFILS